MEKEEVGKETKVIHFKWEDMTERERVLSTRMFTYRSAFKGFRTMFYVSLVGNIIQLALTFIK